MRNEDNSFTPPNSSASCPSIFQSTDDCCTKGPYRAPESSIYGDLQAVVDAGNEAAKRGGLAQRAIGLMDRYPGLAELFDIFEQLDGDL